MAARSGPPFQITYQIALEDYVAATRLLQRNFMLAFGAFGLIILLIGVATLLITDAKLAGVLAMGGGLVGIFAALSPSFQRWRAQNEIRSVLGETIVLELGVEGMAAEGATGSSRIPWTAVTHIVSDARVIVVMRDRISLAWMPVSAFVSSDEHHAALEFMHARVAVNYAPNAIAG